MKPIAAFPFRSQGILVCEDAKRMLSTAGFELICNESGKKLSRDEQKEMIKDAFAVIAGTEPYDEDMLSAAEKLKVIVRFGVGTDNFDLEAMKKRGIEVGVISNYNAVAEFAFTLILSLLKNIPEYDRSVREGKWQRFRMRELSGKTVGIVGLGRIGRRLSKMLGPMNVRILGYDPFVRTIPGVETVSFTELLENSDIVSLHAPATKENFHLMNGETLRLMKDGSYLINPSRGALADERAVMNALDSGKLAGYASDVFGSEPVTPETEILRQKNTVLAPHVAALCEETNYNAGITSARSVINVYNGGKPEYSVF